MVSRAALETLTVLPGAAALASRAATALAAVAAVASENPLPPPPLLSVVVAAEIPSARAMACAELSTLASLAAGSPGAMRGSRVKGGTQDTPTPPRASTALTARRTLRGVEAEEGSLKSLEVNSTPLAPGEAAAAAAEAEAVASTSPPGARGAGKGRPLLCSAHSALHPTPERLPEPGEAARRPRGSCRGYPSAEGPPMSPMSSAATMGGGGRGVPGGRARSNAASPVLAEQAARAAAPPAALPAAPPAAAAVAPPIEARRRLASLASGDPETHRGGGGRLQGGERQCPGLLLLRGRGWGSAQAQGEEQWGGEGGSAAAGCVGGGLGVLCKRKCIPINPGRCRGNAECSGVGSAALPGCKEVGPPQGGGMAQQQGRKGGGHGGGEEVCIAHAGRNAREGEACNGGRGPELGGQGIREKGRAASSGGGGGPGCPQGEGEGGLVDVAGEEHPGWYGAGEGPCSAAGGQGDGVEGRGGGGGRSARCREEGQGGRPREAPQRRLHG